MVTGDTDIMFEPKEVFISDLDTESSSQIGYARSCPFSGLYYVEYNEKCKFPLLTEVLEERNGKRYISS
ncbi:unnamed protein product [Didymodactylos carnosus]|uniref:Uncharacterized protein n=1 Tax=Didymodactylos carnosus TaxID=1234261 RepID=A0A8S2Z1X4_9BILA|nr:unnamed protein product [Didymodactylos carnosus]CAF4483670.1 unnamed protein product [Didymodactylos carnosus]CAF4596575.1 unnamed protein product [Didymodactylos carnosus]